MLDFYSDVICIINSLPLVSGRSATKCLLDWYKSWIINLIAGNISNGSRARVAPVRGGREPRAGGETAGPAAGGASSLSPVHGPTARAVGTSRPPLPALGLRLCSPGGLRPPHHLRQDHAQTAKRRLQLPLARRQVHQHGEQGTRQERQTGHHLGISARPVSRFRHNQLINTLYSWIAYHQSLYLHVARFIFWTFWKKTTHSTVGSATRYHSCNAYDSSLLGNYYYYLRCDLVCDIRAH